VTFKMLWNGFGASKGAIAISCEKAISREFAPG
jgi:hypothetical protein